MSGCHHNTSAPGASSQRLVSKRSVPAERVGSVYAQWRRTARRVSVAAIGLSRAVWSCVMVRSRTWITNRIPGLFGWWPMMLNVKHLRWRLLIKTKGGRITTTAAASTIVTAMTSWRRSTFASIVCYNRNFCMYHLLPSALLHLSSATIGTVTSTVTEGRSVTTLQERLTAERTHAHH